MKNSRPTIAQIMADVNSSKWPARWEAMYDTVMDDYEKNGCIYATPEYYDTIGGKYGMFVEFLDDFKKAAEELAKNDSLCRAFALLCAAMRDRESFAAELPDLETPHSTDGSYHIEYEMLTGLAAVSMADYTYSLLEARGLPQEQVTYAMRLFEEMVRTYKMRNDGRAGAMSFAWYQLAIDAKLYSAPPLQIELFAKFTSKATVFENVLGETVALAQGERFDKEGYTLGSAGHVDEDGAFDAEITETEDAYVGYKYGAYGLVSAEKVTLPKSEWKKLIEPRDPVIAIHIPPGKGLTAELIDESFAQTKQFVAEYFPDFDYKAFVCGSWLMDDQLCDLLGEDKNISKFCRRFSKITRKSQGRAVFSFVFLLPHVSNVDYSKLPENTSLERVLKGHYLDGKAIYECYGYIPKGKI